MPGVSSGQGMPSASQKTTATTPITATVAFDRTIEVTETKTNLTLTPGGGDTVAEFSLTLKGNSDGTLKMRTNGNWFVTDLGDDVFKYTMTINWSSGCVPYPSAVRDGVLSPSGGLLKPQCYEGGHYLAVVEPGKEPTLNFRLTLDQRDLAATPPGIYTKTILFEIVDI